MRANLDKSMISRGTCTEGAACVLVASVCSWSGDDEDRMNHQKPTTEQVRNLKKKQTLAVVILLTATDCSLLRCSYIAGHL